MHTKADRDSRDQRLISYYEKYWQKDEASLKVNKDTLTRDLELLSHKIYLYGAFVLLSAKETMNDIQYNKALDRVIIWILATSETENKGKKVTGFYVNTTLDIPVSVSHSYKGNVLKDHLDLANSARTSWNETFDKLNVISRVIQAKSRDEDLYYSPAYADRVVQVISKSGMFNYETMPLWSSKEATPDKRLPQSEIIEMIEKANQLLSEDPGTYSYNKKAFMSDNLKRELANIFGLGESTIRDRFKNYTQKSEGYYILNKES